MSRSKISLIVSAVMLLYITFNLSNWRQRNMLYWDCGNYYMYLPAVFIYHDLADLKFYPKIVETYYLNNGQKDFNLYPQPTGHTVNKYAVGTSFFELPFFLLAHGYCLLANDKEMPPDGYSTPYMVMVVFSILFWVMAGLYVLRKFLLRYFSDTATALTLLLLMFATNLYFYTVFNIGMSHPFSFTLFCFLLYHTERLYATGHTRYIIYTAAILGMVLITRPTNIVVALIPIFWPYGQTRTIPQRLQFLAQKKWALLTGAILFLLIAMIQFGYFRYTAGKWFHFSYEKEHFEFLQPHIIKGLFSYQKGWYVYTPIAFIATLGLLPLARQHRQLSLLVLSFLAFTVYIVFSWCVWSYGGSFGSRAMIESLAIMAIPLAAFIQWIFTRPVPLRIITLVIFACCITLNAFQSYQLVNNYTVWDHTNKAFYWYSFGRLDVTEEDKQRLLDER
ncbi:hypothetical protein GCM10023093_19770 [Nemorincola caseinilytica]|uniref:Glycosyltransferase RgtA/B/C/D-like domain-containing protein n=1 Tax=Nemorincola caseinilytica TaxID=2054315 RepID=A0ABP8NEV0_9BACT